MTGKIRILFLSANPWSTSRILVDEEAREVFEKLQEGSYRDRFELHRHSAIRPADLQRLLLMYEPHIVHFSGHGSKKQKIILGGTPGRGKQVDRQGLAHVFALYKNHVRLVVLNACFTTMQARSLSENIDYSVGAGKMIDDKEGVAFAGAFYRALGFGKSVKAAFELAKAELALTRMPRTKGLDLFIRKGVNQHDAFPNVDFTIGAQPAALARPVVDSFTTHLNENPVNEPEPQLNVFDASTTIASSSMIYEREFNFCEEAEWRSSSILMKTITHAGGLVRPAEKGAELSSTSLRKSKASKPCKRTLLREKTELHSLMRYSGTHSITTMNVRKISLNGVAAGRRVTGTAHACHRRSRSTHDGPPAAKRPE